MTPARPVIFVASSVRPLVSDPVCGSTTARQLQKKRTEALPTAKCTVCCGASNQAMSLRSIARNESVRTLASSESAVREKSQFWLPSTTAETIATMKIQSDVLSDFRCSRPGSSSVKLLMAWPGWKYRSRKIWGQPKPASGLAVRQTRSVPNKIAKPGLVGRKACVSLAESVSAHVAPTYKTKPLRRAAMRPKA